MDFFGKLFNSSKPRLETPDDDPNAKRLRSAQQKHDWKTMQEFFNSLADFDEREFYVEKLADWKRRPPFINAWVEANPKSAEAWLVRGAHGVQWAWEARSSARAEDVAENAWPIFYERLKQAWSDLNQAVELNPADPTPFGHLITCAMGLGLEKEIVFSCLQNTIDRSAMSWKAHSAALWFLCKKWHGSHEEMFEFARMVNANVPEGSGLHALIPIAHQERWLYALGFDEEEELAGKYYEQPDVRSEILDAYNRSLGSRAHKANKSTIYQSSFFAFSLLHGHAFNQAFAELERIGNSVPKFPWAFLGAPAEKFIQAKEIAKANLK